MNCPLQIKTVRGTPIRVYGRTFVPIARVISLVRHRATIRRTGYDAVGWGGVWVQPLAVVEYDGDRAHTLLIPDRTATVLRQMAAVALALPVLCLAVVSLARRMRHG